MSIINRTSNNATSEQMTSSEPPPKRLKPGLASDLLPPPPPPPPPEWRLFPTKLTPQFEVGDQVLVRRSSSTTKYQRGVIQSMENSNITIRLNISSSESEASRTMQTIKRTKDRRRLLLPDLSAQRSILVTPETNFFRTLVAHTLPVDRVLEVGCSTGETSKLLVPQCASWVGFDTSQEMLDTCTATLASSISEKKEEESCSNHRARHAVVIDALVDPAKAKREARTLGNPTVVFLDIGGNRECINVLRMVSWVLDEFEPRLLVIKSRELVQRLQSLTEHRIHKSTGIMENGHQWFQSNRKKLAVPKHPLKAAMVMSPMDPENPICRYFNYHKNGCKRKECTFDHTHCHACLQKGHVARECPTLEVETRYSVGDENS